MSTNSTIYRALVLINKADLDSSDSRFNWASVITTNPRDTEGNSVRNPGNIMLYGAKGMSQGDCEELLLKARGVEGLFDVIPVDAADKVLAKLNLTMEEIPEVPLAESSASSMSRAEASKRARERRRERAISGATSSVEAEKETTMA